MEDSVLSWLILFLVTYSWMIHFFLCAANKSAEEKRRNSNEWRKEKW